MIITPQELQRWRDEGKSFNVVDIRSEEQRMEFPLTDLNPIVVDANTIPKFENEIILICQYGIITEEIINEQDLDNAYSLLGGVQAWNVFLSEQEDLSRWSRQTILPEIGHEGQKKLLNSTVAVVGIGGLGCPVAQSLVAAGVGKLKIIDGDKVELSNLHRQPLFGVEDVGQYKVSAAKEKLIKLNDSTLIEQIEEFLTNDNGLSFLHDADIVVDGTDNIEVRQLIDKFSKELGIPMVYGGLYRYEGQVAVLNVDGCPGYSELFPDSLSGGDTCADAGVLGMLPGIIGNIQALETVKILVGIKPNLIGKLLIYDGLTHTTNVIEIG